MCGNFALGYCSALKPFISVSQFVFPFAYLSVCLNSGRNQFEESRHGVLLPFCEDTFNRGTGNLSCVLLTVVYFPFKKEN